MTGHCSSLVHGCKWGRRLYTTTALSCCIPTSYCHLSAALQTMSVIVVNLQDIQTVFRIFIILLIFHLIFTCIKLLHISRELFRKKEYNLGTALYIYIYKI